MESSQIKKSENLKMNLFLLILSSFMFVTANPGIISPEGNGFLAWFYYIPVLFLIDRLDGKKVIAFGGLYGALSYGFFVCWLLKYDFLTFIAVCILYFLIFAVIFVLIKFTKKLSVYNSWFYSFIILSLYEIIKTYGFLGFSYGETGYTQWQNYYFNQIGCITGVHGITILLIFSSCLLYGIIDKLIRRKNSKIAFEEIEQAVTNETLLEINRKKIQTKKVLSLKSNIIVLFLFLSVVIFSVFYSVFQINHSANYKTIKIAAIQNNEDPWKNGLNVNIKNIQNLIALTEEVLEVNKDTKLVVWPETAVVPAIEYNYFNPDDKNKYMLVKTLLEYFNKKDIAFVTGNFNRQINSDGSFSDFNSALFFRPRVNIIPPSPEVYSKIHLVPFTEYFPYKKIFPFVYSALLKGDTHMWEPGKDFTVFNLNDFLFSTPICFEDTFCDISAKMVKNGARCFINLSNDAWSKSKSCQIQHLSMAVFRSIENRVPCIRSTSSGETCLIDQKGFIKIRADSFCESYVCGEIDVLPVDYKLSFFTMYGEYIEKAVVLVFLLILIIKIFIVIINKHLIKKQVQNGR